MRAVGIVASEFVRMASQLFTRGSLRRLASRVFAGFMLLGLVAWASACVSYVDVRPPAKGSVENPVECGSPLEQRGYLKRLRGSDLERRLEFEYLDSVPGPRDVILDRFRVENPAPDERGFFDVLLDEFRSEPEDPPAVRIYMSIYGPSPCEVDGVPGYRMLTPETDAEPAKDQPNGS